MPIDFDAIIGDLQREQVDLQRNAIGTAGRDLFEASERREDLVEQLRSGLESPAASQAVDQAANDRFAATGLALEQAAGNARGRLRTGAAARGALGGSGAARGLGEIEGSLEEGRLRAARATEAFRADARRLRQQRATEILDSILNDDFAGGIIGGQIQGLQAGFGTSQALQGLDQVEEGILSQSIGSVLDSAGRFGAAGFDAASMANRRQFAETGTPGTRRFY